MAHSTAAPFFLTVTRSARIPPDATIYRTACKKTPAESMPRAKIVLKADNKEKAAGVHTPFWRFPGFRQRGRLLLPRLLRRATGWE